MVYRLPSSWCVPTYSETIRKEEGGGGRGREGLREGETAVLY